MMDENVLIVDPNLFLVYVVRFGAKASLASSANSRKKMLDKMVKVDAPITATKRPR